MKRVDFRNNQLSSLPEGLFSGAGNLQTVRLSYNKLENLPKGLFAGLANVETIDLGNNQLANPPDEIFKDILSLKRVYLNNNQLSSFSEGLFRVSDWGLSNLQYISLANNLIRRVPDKLQDFPSLQTIDLSNN